MSTALVVARFGPCAGRRADAESTTLRAAALASGEVSATGFDRIVDARTMTGLVG